MNVIIILAAAVAANIYSARVVHVVDGDTVRVEIAIWQDQAISTSIRLRGIDTPEIRGKCARERELALKAKAALAEILPAGSLITISRIRPDKYGGRYDADVQTSTGRDPAAELIAADLARPYQGAARAGWCEL